ncbi:MAG: M15 family metallopeptidase [Bacteroidota bacterium]
MSCKTILGELIKDGTLGQVLQKSDTPRDEVKAFKQILYELGFEEVKNAQTQEIDGLYGDSTVATVKSFCEKNNIPTDGEKVTVPIAQAILKRHASLPDMLQLHFDLQNGKISDKYFKGSPDKQAIAALQQLLHDLGFKDELEWDKYKNNGVYGAATVNAVQAFIDNKEKDLKEKLASLQPKHGLLHKGIHLISHLLEKGGLATILKKSDLPHPAVTELQKVLHHLGFGKHLGQKMDQLDGIFGHKVVDAVQSFANKNGLQSDGTKITQHIASALKKRMEQLPFMHQLQRDLREGKIEQKYFKGSTDKVAIGALQSVLKDLGMGKALKWDQKANDGVFDNLVANALKTYFKKGFLDQPKKLSPHMAQSLLNDIGQKYGPDWTDHVKEHKGSKSSPLVIYTNTQFRGDTITTNPGFIPSLEKINQYAVQNKVLVHITNSYRQDTYVPGAIVPPASMSNHKVGHAIDMNLSFDGGQWANSHYMNPSNRNNWAAPVRGFLEAISNDDTLRWGGDFQHTEVDPVHIDDGLNLADPDEWHKLRPLTVKAYKDGDIGHWKG